MKSLQGKIESVNGEIVTGTKKVYTRSGLISFPNKCFSCASEPLGDLFNTGKQIGFTQLKEIEQQKSLNFFTK